MLWVACKNPFAQDFDRSKMKKRLKNWKWWSAPISSSTKRCNTLISCCPLPPRLKSGTWMLLTGTTGFPLISRRLSRCMKQNATLKSLPCCRAPLIRWRRVPVPSARVRSQALAGSGVQRRYGENVWHLFLGRSAGRAEKAILPSSAAWYDRKFKTPSGKYEFKSELAEKTATPRCRNTNRKPRANCLSICLRRMCSSVSIRNLLTLTGCRCSIRNRLFISILLPRRKRH